MVQYGYQAIKQFPRSEKYTFAAEIKSTMIRILKLIIRTNKKYYKKTTMKDLDIELELLKTYIRLARDLNFLPFKKYEIWSKQLHEIGRLIGGWMKSVQK
jgi:ribonucleotide reductase beta subunit family protein with ferritin-like domain